MVTKHMSLPARREYLKREKARYLKAAKPEKSIMLSEFCQNTGYNKKYAIRILAAGHSYKDKCLNRKIHYTYTKEDIYYLKQIWEVMDYSCGQRLAPQLPEVIAKLIQFKELKIPETAAEKLKRISSSTIDERLKNYRSELRRTINSTTKPGSLIKKQIPIRTSSWDEQRIGCCELDTVAHAGDNAAGEFIVSLDLTDILTGWTETEAVLGKAQSRIIAGLENIKDRLPFPLLAIDPDNGSEFINWQLWQYCLDRSIEFTRGRPYAKNDNAHIEQKNWTQVRKVFGYGRRETAAELEIMNDLYRNEIRLYKNFFMASVKLIQKKRVGQNGEKIKRIYDQAKTPYQRVLECDQVSEEVKLKLRERYATLNPAELRRNIQAKLEKLSRANKIIINDIINQTVVLNPAAKVTFSRHRTN
ncbi:MAG TPA: transposase [Candidatus Methylomirabilis sp.]|nr:transposase [Candidatus Methylomirabilis sp.]